MTSAGPGPFGSSLWPQPVPGAQRGLTADGWKTARAALLRRTCAPRGWRVRRREKSPTCQINAFSQSVTALHCGSQGKLCDVSKAPYSAVNGTNATAALQAAIDDCGDLPGEGGTVLVPSPLKLLTGAQSRTRRTPSLAATPTLPQAAHAPPLPAPSRPYYSNARA